MRGLGHIPDARAHVDEDLRARHVGLLLGPRVGAIPDIVDYSPMLDRVPDQGRTNSCVGQAFATAIYLRAHLAGIPLPRPSAKAIYDFARLEDEPTVLLDNGSRPRAAIDGMLSYGLVADARWPLTAETVNLPPPLDVFRAGIGAALSAYYRCDGVDVASQIRAALAQKFIPAFAMDVDDAYEAYDGSAIYPGLSGAVRGSHMQAVVGYGADYFLVANSWGESWGRGGLAKIAPAFFNSTAVRDVLVCTVVPRTIT